jgi:hypothetical protein
MTVTVTQIKPHHKTEQTEITELGVVSWLVSTLCTRFLSALFMLTSHYRAH